MRTLATLKRVNTYDKHKLTLTADEALKAFGETIYRLAYSYVRNETDAEDIFQDVFMNFLKYGTTKEFDSWDHAKNWFIRVTINCYYHFIKVSKRRMEIEDSEQIIDLQSIEEAPQKNYGILTEAVGELKEKYRTVVHLFYYEGYKVKEIANLLEENENTIKTRLSRAKKVLKEKLADGR